MRATTVLRNVLSLKDTRVTSVDFDDDGILVGVAPMTRVPFCSGCGCRARRVYDRRSRRWRHLDLAGMETTLLYEQRRVDCRRCQAVLAELVPWAAPGLVFTRDFEDQVAYLAQVADRTMVSKQMRIAWVTVGGIVKRVIDRLRPGDRLDGLEEIGIDELSYRRHHEYITVVVDHRARRVVWCGEGKNADTVRSFFAALGPDRCAKLKTVSIDMSAAYIEAVSGAAPHARIVYDRFHVQRLAHDALDEVRRDQFRLLAGTDEGKALKKSRWALHKNPWNLTAIEGDKVVAVQRANKPLFRAYMLKESLAAILDGRQVNVARDKLEEWLAWAARSRLPPFKKLAKTIRRHIDGILAYVATGLSNGPTEALNGKIRTITRRAYGFHSSTNLIAFIYLCCTGIDLGPVFKRPTSHPLAI
jgi:transposase